MTRKKKIINRLISKEDFERNQIDFAQAEARLRKINAQIDLSVLKIKEKYATEIGTLAKVKDNAFDGIYSYCEHNKDTLFTKRKSIQTAFGTLGYRLGTPKLKTLRGFTWAAVLQLLRDKLPDYVRTKQEPNKEALLADREKLALNTVGCRVDNDETFYIDVKEEEL